MSRRTRLLVLTATVLAGLDPVGRAAAQPPGTLTFRTISKAELDDRVRGGWAGQMIGVSFGAPTEFKSNGKIIEGDLPA